MRYYPLAGFERGFIHLKWIDKERFFFLFQRFCVQFCTASDLCFIISSVLNNATGFFFHLFLDDKRNLYPMPGALDVLSCIYSNLLSVLNKRWEFWFLEIWKIRMKIIKFRNDVLQRREKRILFFSLYEEELYEEENREDVPWWNIIL